MVTSHTAKRPMNKIQCITDDLYKYINFTFFCFGDLFVLLLFFFFYAFIRHVSAQASTISEQIVRIIIVHVASQNNHG